eukprot:11332049-Ditylum_brightwellii.AAC.1
MLDGDADPIAIDHFHVMACSTCGGTMHNRCQCRVSHDGFGNAMLVAEIDKSTSKGCLMVEINHMTVKNPLPCSMEEYNSMRENSSFSTLPFVAVCKAVLDTTHISLENVSLVDHDSGRLDDYNKYDNNNDINKDGCNSNFNAQGTLDDLPLTQEKFAFEKIEKLMANDIACHAAKNNKVKELHCILMNLNIYDDEAESVLLSALGEIESDDYPESDNDTESFPPKLTL